jgi:hypothetical protein
MVENAGEPGCGESERELKDIHSARTKKGRGSLPSRKVYETAVGN